MSYAATATVLLSGIAIWGTLRGLGPFARETPHESMLLLQGFVGLTALLAMALRTLGLKARSLTGPQVGMRTDNAHTRARITRITGERVRAALDAGEIAVIAGLLSLVPLFMSISYLKKSAAPAAVA